jgi:hypothetical protein
MEAVKIKYGHLNELFYELSGMKDPKTGEIFTKGIMNQKLKFKTKFFLNEILEEVTAQKEKVDAAVKELMEKYGELTEDGSALYIPEKISQDGEDIINPNVEKFNKDISDFLNSWVEIKQPDLTIDDFDGIETDENYTMLFKFISK